VNANCHKQNSALAVTGAQPTRQPAACWGSWETGRERLGERDWARETGRETGRARLGEPPHMHAKNDQTGHNRSPDYICAHGVGELNTWRQTVPVSYPHEAVVDLASHAAGHFGIRGATRTLRYLRGFQHPARRPLLAVSIWSSRTSSASDMFSSGAKRTWLSQPIAPLAYAAGKTSAPDIQYIAMQRDSLPRAVLGRLPSRMEESPSAPTMTCNNPHSFFLAILRANRRVPGFNPTSRPSAARRHGGLSRDPTQPRGSRILCYCLLPGRFLCFLQLCSRLPICGLS
jgi:hypothetical protein